VGDEITLRPQGWFEMPEVRRRAIAGAVWIPLRESRLLESDGELSEVGFIEEYSAAYSVAVPTVSRPKVDALEWSDLQVHSHRGYRDEDEYVPAHVFRHDDLSGEHLALERAGNQVEAPEWALSQDLELTLQLKREGDTWVAFTRGYEDVARVERAADGRPHNLVIRASYLLDYLCARSMGLVLRTFRSRRQVLDSASHINWPSNPYEERCNGDRWSGRVTAIHEGQGSPFGDGYAVLHMARKDVDYDDDVPVPGPPTNDAVTVKKWSGQFTGRQVYRIEGELWRSEWIPPAAKSPIVLRDSTPPPVRFITDATGTTQGRGTLMGDTRWLWFRPSVVNALLTFRASKLEWFTEDTGQVECSPGYGIQFGVNEAGLVNVFAKDVAALPDWQQRVWGGHNVGPDGKVSRELLMCQMAAKPADTRAPEADLADAIAVLRAAILAVIGDEAFRDHAEAAAIIAKTHRFRAVEAGGLFELASNLTKLIAERIDASKIKATLKLPKEDQKLGSLKSLERLVASHVRETRARELLGTLFGIYDLRLADAHLSSSDVESGYARCGVDPLANPTEQGREMICAAVAACRRIADALQATAGGGDASAGSGSPSGLSGPASA
jgi:hypothetical protein